MRRVELILTGSMYDEIEIQKEILEEELSGT
jgi:hypothetical protein